MLFEYFLKKLNLFIKKTKTIIIAISIPICARINVFSSMNSMVRLWYRLLFLLIIRFYLFVFSSLILFYYLFCFFFFFFAFISEEHTSVPTYTWLDNIERWVNTSIDSTISQPLKANQSASKLEYYVILFAYFQSYT